MRHRRSGLVAACVLSWPFLGDIGGTPSLGLRKQLAKANIVAFVTVVAGDANTLPTIFRCRVTEALKGAKAGDVICFQTGDQRLELRTEYLLLLETKREKASTATPEAVSRVCGGQNQSILLTTASPLPVRYTYEVRSLCPDRNCPFGVDAVDVWSSGLGPLPDFVAGTQVGNGLRGIRFWIRKAELILALRWELAAL
jgi:hypothetical protein